MITFPTWHRPYMALVEQTLGKLMPEVIASLTFSREDDKAAWVDAAAKWRLPYWDWALPIYAKKIPELFRAPNIHIRIPLAADRLQPTPQTVPNPLARTSSRSRGN